MKCAICKTGDMESGFTTVTLERGETTVVIKNVPAQVCQQCGDYYLDDAMTAQVLSKAENAVSKGAQVEVLRWAA